MISFILEFIIFLKKLFILALEVNPVTQYACTIIIYCMHYSSIFSLLWVLERNGKNSKNKFSHRFKKKNINKRAQQNIFLTFWLFKIWNYNSFCILLFLWGQKYFVSSNSIASNVTQNFIENSNLTSDTFHLKFPEL